MKFLIGNSGSAKAIQKLEEHNKFKESKPKLQLCSFDDPFSKESIVGITIRYSRGYFGVGPHWWGNVEFKKNNTSGEYKVDNKSTMQAVTAELEAFIKTL